MKKAKKPQWTLHIGTVVEYKSSVPKRDQKVYNDAQLALVARLQHQQKQRINVFTYVNADRLPAVVLTTAEQFRWKDIKG
jgi:hypothetical protein